MAKDDDGTRFIEDDDKRFRRCLAVARDRGQIVEQKADVYAVFDGKRLIAQSPNLDHLEIYFGLPTP